MFMTEGWGWVYWSLLSVIHANFPWSLHGGGSTPLECHLPTITNCQGSQGFQSQSHPQLVLQLGIRGYTCDGASLSNSGSIKRLIANNPQKDKIKASLSFQKAVLHWIINLRSKVITFKYFLYGFGLIVSKYRHCIGYWWFITIKSIRATVQYKISIFQAEWTSS